MKAYSLHSLSDSLRKILRSDMLLTSSSIVSEDNSSSVFLKFNNDDSMAINCALLRFPWLSDLSAKHLLHICKITSAMLHLLFSSFSSSSFSNQIKSILLSHHHSTCALVSEILENVLQTIYLFIYLFITICYLFITIYLFSHLADNFIQSDLQMRTL